MKFLKKCDYMREIKLKLCYEFMKSREAGREQNGAVGK
jgi:hypothetical protein